MNWKRSVLFMLLVWVMSACSLGRDMPQSTRTGKIHDVRVGESIEPKVIQARWGDEVRWINARQMPIRIVFVDSFREQVACQKDFKISDTATLAKIDANEYASLCFVSPGAYIYNARMDSPVPGGEINAVGRVVVE